MMEKQKELEPWQIVIRETQEHLENRRRETINFTVSPWDKKFADSLLVKIQTDAKSIDELLKEKPELPVCTIDCKTDFERCVDELFKLNRETEQRLRRHFDDFHHATMNNTNARATIAACVFAGSALVSSKLEKMATITPLWDALITLSAGIGCFAFLTSQQIKTKMTVMIDQRKINETPSKQSLQTSRPRQGNIYPIKPPGINL